MVVLKNLTDKSTNVFASNWYAVMHIDIYSKGDSACQPFCFSTIGRNLGINRQCWEINEKGQRVSCANYINVMYWPFAELTCAICEWFQKRIELFDITSIHIFASSRPSQKCAKSEHALIVMCAWFGCLWKCGVQYRLFHAYQHMRWAWLRYVTQYNKRYIMSTFETFRFLHYLTEDLTG